MTNQINSFNRQALPVHYEHQTSRITFEMQITPDNYPALKSLVLEQAQHHNCTFRGQDETFLQALNAENPIANIILMRGEEQQPLGYILYNVAYGPEGTTVYMEDLLVSSAQRSNGAGIRLIEQLKSVAQSHNADRISWVVSDSNTRAIEFYKNRVGAEEQSYDSHDLAHLLDQPPEQNPDMVVRILDHDDLTTLGHQRQLSGHTLENLQRAHAGEHSTVYAAFDQAGFPVALGVTNVNFSSFRTVYGLELELMELSQPGETAEAVAGFQALAHQIVMDARKNNQTGHLNFFSHQESPAQQQFAETMNGLPLTMTEDPETYLRLFAINREHIYDTVPVNTPLAVEPTGIHM